MKNPLMKNKYLSKKKADIPIDQQEAFHIRIGAKDFYNEKPDLQTFTIKTYNNDN